MEDVGTFYGHLIHILLPFGIHILMPFGLFCDRLNYFNGIGILYQKFCNPGKQGDQMLL
jgi:hypothetical protein